MRSREMTSQEVRATISAEAVDPSSVLTPRLLSDSWKARRNINAHQHARRSRTRRKSEPSKKLDLFAAVGVRVRDIRVSRDSPVVSLTITMISRSRYRPFTAQLRKLSDVYQISQTHAGPHPSLCLSSLYDFS